MTLKITSNHLSKRFCLSPQEIIPQFNDAYLYLCVIVTCSLSNSLIAQFVFWKMDSLPFLFVFSSKVWVGFFLFCFLFQRGEVGFSCFCFLFKRVKWVCYEKGFGLLLEIKTQVEIIRVVGFVLFGFCFCFSLFGVFFFFEKREMFPSVLLSNSASLSEEATVFSSTRVQDFGSLNPMVSSAINDNSPHQQPQKIKKKRNLPGNPGKIYVILANPKKKNERYVWSSTFKSYLLILT